MVQIFVFGNFGGSNWGLSWRCTFDNTLLRTHMIMLLLLLLKKQNNIIHMAFIWLADPRAHE